MFSGVDQEIEWVKSRVAARFPVYETRVTPQAVAFVVTIDPTTMEAQFDDLRLELVPKNYIPFLTKEGGEHLVLVQRRPQQRFVSAHVNLLLLIATLATTVWAGAVNWAGYDNIDWLSLEAFARGSLFFTLPLMGILAIHEMGHYVVAKRYKVHASLPFFLPAPGTFLGTFGAMISMRDPIPNRKALIDIGAAGPVLGLLAAVPVTIVGLLLMSVDPRPVPENIGGGLTVELPLLYQLLALFVPIPGDVLLHPTAFAGWVGLFVTALNLLPAGQLDGGHVARAVLGDRSKYLSYAAIAGMLLLGVFYFGWFIIAVFILMLGARHPPPLNDLVRLDGKRQGLAAGALAVMLLSFVAIPVGLIPPVADVTFTTVGQPDVAVDEVNVSVGVGNITTYTFRAVNTGNVRTNVSLELDVPWPPSLNLFVTLETVRIGNVTITASANRASFEFNATDVARITFRVNATAFPASQAGNWEFQISTRIAGEGVPPFRLDAPLVVTLRVA